MSTNTNTWSLGVMRKETGFSYRGSFSGYKRDDSELLPSCFGRDKYLTTAEGNFLKYNKYHNEAGWILNEACKNTVHYCFH